MVHSSTYLATREALLDGIGLVDESIPGSQSEDWDLVLRAARRAPIVNVDEALVLVTWDTSGTRSRGRARSPGWSGCWRRILRSLRRGPGRPGSTPRSHSAILPGRRGLACRGRSGGSSNWHERRLPFVAAVATGAMSGERLMRTLHARARDLRIASPSSPSPELASTFSPGPTGRERRCRDSRWRWRHDRDAEHRYLPPHRTGMRPVAGSSPPRRSWFPTECRCSRQAGGDAAGRADDRGGSDLLAVRGGGCSGRLADLPGRGHAERGITGRPRLSGRRAAR